MSNVSLIILCLVLVGIALLIVSFINAQQMRKRLINQKLAQLKRKVIEMDELTAATETLTGSTSIAKVMLEETIDMLRGMQQLSPDSQAVELQIETAMQRMNEVSTTDYRCVINRLMESDAAIARAQYLLGEAGRILRKRQNQNKIELALMTAHIEELAWAHLMVGVITLIGQGHKAVRRGDILRAHAFYKKAQEATKGSTLADNRRHTLIKQIADLMSNNRKSISTDLMPETQYNPEDAPPGASPSATPIPETN